MTFQPMLASPIELDKVKYPVYCSPKYDGIRCVIREGVALSRKLKEIPNKHIAEMLKQCPNNIDGELMIEHSNFNQIQSAVMSEAGTPEFIFLVFDVISTDNYLDRMSQLSAMELPAFCKKVLPHRFNNEDDMLEYERECVEDYEFEGIMIRSPTGPYKFGRSTPKQGYLLKLKRFADAEGTIVGFEEMMHNENEKTKDALGHSKRSSKKEGMVPADMLGAFVVQTPDGVKFRVSTGMTMDDRKMYWHSQESLLGKLVKYKFQESDGKPRFPVFLGIRHPDDT